MAIISDLTPENTIVDSDGNEAKVSDEHLKIEMKQADFRLLITYQAKIIKELSQIKEILKELGE